QHHPARVHRHAHAAEVRGQGPARRGRRPPCRAHTGAPRGTARGHRRHLLVPGARRGRLHHRPGHRRQRRPQHLIASLVLLLPPGSARTMEINALAIIGTSFFEEYAAAMARNRPTADAPATDRPGSWRELAVARSLDPARARAEERVQRFLDAAVELMMENRTGK